MYDTVVLDGELELVIAADGDCELTLAQDGEMGLFTNIGDRPAYTGETTVTPTTATQVLATAGKVVLENITVNPIPSNYGLVTWDGSVLTVS